MVHYIRGVNPDRWTYLAGGPSYVFKDAKDYTEEPLNETQWIWDAQRRFKYFFQAIYTSFYRKAGTVWVRYTGGYLTNITKQDVMDTGPGSDRELIIRGLMEFRYNNIVFSPFLLESRNNSQVEVARAK